ncbi:alkaline phosphatase [Synchytrium microbalum]|uniref:Alkaline phosphatase n=1 Tax=Synchytrium microbalum TaxID=1806994 RepID=A0A507BX33_9FUNG|nr:alkaline phosphatase [Synchytrium microbalum]TPX30354.1 alkaline phosphatase [Synchytrium microbalum]
MAEASQPLVSHSASDDQIVSVNDDLLENNENHQDAWWTIKRKQARSFHIPVKIEYLHSIARCPGPVEINRVTVFFIVLASQRRNVILMISDGFGPASQTMARNYYTAIHNLAAGHQLPLDTIQVGSVRTRSSSSLVTDSAAGATAYSCALKTYNGAIGVDPDEKPCGTVLEAAKIAGYRTGLVATSRITHATPASFCTHVSSRDMENDIALQLIGNYSLGRTVDLAFGGGLCHFLPNTSSSSCRFDALAILNMAASRGWNMILDKHGFDALNLKSPLPILGLFTPDHMSYEIDRKATNSQPSLAEMSSKALEILLTASLSSADEKGFFLMIEGSRIDMAGHSNDAAAHVLEILAYNDAVEVVKAFVDKTPNTIMISTSDHETGGLSVAKQLTSAYPEYKWIPEALTKAKNSTEVLGQYLASTFPSGPTESLIRDILSEWLGITDPTPDEIAYLTTPHLAIEYDYFMGPMISTRAMLGWSTHGHSAVDVNLYAYGHRASDLKGNIENTDVGRFMERYLGVRLDSVTKRLQSQSIWHVPKVDLVGRAPYQELHYHSKPGYVA